MMRVFGVCACVDQWDKETVYRSVYTVPNQATLVLRDPRKSCDRYPTKLAINQHKKLK